MAFPKTKIRIIILSWNSSRNDSVSNGQQLRLVSLQMKLVLRLFNFWWNEAAFSKFEFAMKIWKIGMGWNFANILSSGLNVLSRYCLKYQQLRDETTRLHKLSSKNCHQTRLNWNLRVCNYEDSKLCCPCHILIHKSLLHPILTP